MLHFGLTSSEGITGEANLAAMNSIRVPSPPAALRIAARAAWPYEQRP